MVRNLDYKADLLADLRDKPAFIGEYLSAAYADSQEAFLVALRDVAEAQKGMAQVAKQARVNRENLYRTLSRQGNPTLSTLTAVLDTLGLEISVAAKNRVSKNPAPGPLAANPTSEHSIAIKTKATKLTGPICVEGLAVATGWFGTAGAVDDSGYPVHLLSTSTTQNQPSI